MMVNCRNRGGWRSFLLGIMIVGVIAGCVSQNVQNKPAALALDEEISRRSFALRDTPRWLLAVSDADLEAAGAELAAVRKKGLKPHRDCGAESTALAVKPSLAQ